MRRHLREIIARLEAMGCTEVKLESDRRHPRLTMAHAGRLATITVSGTPKNEDDAVHLAVQDARRELGLTGGAPKPRVPCRRRPRRHEKAAGRLLIPTPVAPPRQDGRAKLESHPHYPAVLELRLQAAFAALWEDICMQRFGRPSVTKTLFNQRVRDD